MKLSVILANMEVVYSNADPQIEISGLSYDSRKVENSYVFFAISGFETDGNIYIPNAIEKGASVVVCEKVPEAGIPYILVNNCRRALAMASCAFYDYPADKMKVIGITGTNGKTTSTYLIKHILETTKHAKVGIVGTNGNMIGNVFLPTERTTPESLELNNLFSEMSSSGCSYVVMEVSSHSLQLDRVSGIHFSSAEFTNLTQDHLDFHKSMENYAEAKKRLFSLTDNTCINADDEWSEFMADGHSGRLITFSAEDNSAILHAKNVVCSDKSVSFTAVYNKEECQVSLSIPGKFSVYNALGAMAVCLSLGLSLDEVSQALSDAKGVMGRLEVVPTNTDYSVIIDYAHTPDALENVLNALRPITKGRLITVFGCGGDRDRIKRPIMGSTVAELSDYFFVTSDNPRTEKPESIIQDILEGVHTDISRYTVECDRIKAIHAAIDMAVPDDVILLAGKGHETYQVIGHEKHHMDEREIVLDYIKETRK